MTSDDELTLEGFYSLHKMTATDSEDGVAELWDILVAMGYNKDLALQYVCKVMLLYCLFPSRFNGY